MRKRADVLTTVGTVAGVGLGLAAVLALSLFGLFFYEYGWLGRRQFNSSSFMVLYYGGPLLVALLLLTALRLRPIQRLKVLLVVVSVGATTYCLELFLVWHYSSLYATTRPVMTVLGAAPNKKNLAAALTTEWGYPIDTRTAEEVVTELQRSHADAIPVITPSNHLFITQPDGNITSSISVEGREVMPLGTVSNRITLLCNESGQWIHYRSDERGFNNPAGIWQTDRLELAVLGDSFAQGYCVPGDRNFVALMRRRYPATLNLGIAGDGPLLMAATLKEYLPRFKPETVLWFYFEGNDLTDLRRELRNPLLSHYLKDDFTQPLLARQFDLDRAIVNDIPRLRALDQRNREKAAEVGTSTRVTSFLKLASLRQRMGMIGGMDDPDVGAIGPDNISMFRALLLQAKTRVEGWDGRLVFVYLPDWTRYTRETSFGELARDQVLTMVSDLGIPIVDINTAFTAHGDPLSMFPFRRPGHYNETGHRLVAEAVLHALGQDITTVSRHPHRQ